MASVLTYADRVLLQLLRVGLGPLGRAEEHRLLAVPRAVDDRALRRQPLFDISPSARASSSSGTRPDTGSSAPFTHASWWLPRTIHSSGNCTPGCGRHVEHGLQVPVERDLQVHLRRAGADVPSGPAVASGPMREHPRPRAAGRGRQRSFCACAWAPLGGVNGRAFVSRRGLYVTAAPRRRVHLAFASAAVPIRPIHPRRAQMHLRVSPSEPNLCVDGRDGKRPVADHPERPQAVTARRDRSSTVRPGQPPIAAESRACPRCRASGTARSAGHRHGRGRTPRPSFFRPPAAHSTALRG